MARPPQHLTPEAEDRILVFIPAYNCGPQIGRVLAKLDRMPAGLFEEVLLVDNQSSDGTPLLALEAAKEIHTIPITVVRNRENYGLGGSHKSAFAYATQKGYTHVIVLHGDDQGNIADVLPVLATGMHRRFDCCLGSRFARASRLKGYSAIRMMGNYVFNTLFSLVSRRLVTDLGSGLNILSRRVFSDPALLHYSDDLRFNCYLLLGLVASGRSFRYFPITWVEEDQISNVKIFSQSLNTLKILAQYLFSRRAFQTMDHRTVAHQSYVFDVVGSNQPAPERVLEAVAR